MILQSRYDYCFSTIYDYYYYYYMSSYNNKQIVFVFTVFYLALLLNILNCHSISFYKPNDTMVRRRIFWHDYGEELKVLES